MCVVGRWHVAEATAGTLAAALVAEQPLAVARQPVRKGARLHVLRPPRGEAAAGHLLDTDLAAHLGVAKAFDDPIAAPLASATARAPV